MVAEVGCEGLTATLMSCRVGCVRVRVYNRFFDPVHDGEFARMFVYMDLHVNLDFKMCVVIPGRRLSSSPCTD